MSKTISIQPAQRSNGQLPYPYHIDRKGKVGRQDFWKGEPLELMGFNGAPVAGTVEPACGFEDFWENPEIAIGKYPIFANKKREWHTYTEVIESIHINK